jgi:glyoxylase-like metal-dependent hydrolase (beta-lactamase superfamily II)
MKFEVIPVSGAFENAYILKGEHPALVDTMAPMSRKRLMKALDRAGVPAEDIEFILITHHHFDHTGNLMMLKRLSSATVIAGAADVPVIEGSAPQPPPSSLNRLGRMLGRLPAWFIRWYQRYERVGVDRAVSGGEVIDELGLEVIALPGHTAGGVGYLDREGSRAFIGDIVSNYFSKPGMPTVSASESLEQIAESQATLARMGLETAYPGHGAVIGPGASQLISDMLVRRSKKG